MSSARVFLGSLVCLALLPEAGAHASLRDPHPPRPVVCPAAPPVDHAALGGLLAANDYPALEAALRRYRDAYRAEPSCEQALWTACGFWLDYAESDRTGFDGWAAARPEAFEAHLARGVFWYRRAVLRRGVGYFSSLPPERVAAMREAAALARSDLERAIELDPAHPVPYGGLMEMHKLAGERAALRATYARGIAVAPSSFELRARMMSASEPWWGGSFAEMEQIAEQAAPYVAHNPRIAMLRGYVPAARGLDHFLNERWEEAIAAYDAALAYGEIGSEWHLRRMRALHYARRWADLLRDAQLLLAHGDSGSYEQRAGFEFLVAARIGLGDRQAALRDAERAVTAVPDSGLLWGEKGRILEMLGQIADAERAYARAAEVAPTSKTRRWALHLRADALDRMGRYADADRVREEAVQIGDGLR